MQTPSASDPSFKAFLEKLQDQNNRGFLTQLAQLKSERETAGEDADKREEQLDEVISSLKEVRLAVTGIDINVDLSPLINIGENQTKLLEELNKEASLTRKLTEGSVEYDKEAAQYRNTSGRDIESKVSGKTSKQGGFIDFETARDTLSGQGKRVKDDNAFSLKPIDYTPGKMAAAAVGAKDKSKNSEEIEDPLDRSFFGRVKDSAKFWLTDGESEKPGYGAFQKLPKEVEKKDREAKVSSPRQENPEADNITTTGEIQADAAKSDIELSKQMLDTTKEQLTVLKEIRDALAPKTPAELTEQKSAPSSTTEKEDSTGPSVPNIPDIDLPDRRRNVPRRVPPGSRTRVPPSSTRPSNIGRLMKSGGTALAVGAGAYTAYTGVTEAEESKQEKLEGVQALVEAGELTPEAAATQRKEIGNTATVEKSGAVGEGTGLAGGAIAGGLAGAKIGATIGTFFGPGIGTAVGAGVGGLAGGALGAFAGSGAGKYVGEAVGGGINTAKNFFGLGDKKSNPSEGKLSEAKSVTSVDGEKLPESEKSLMKLKGYNPDVPDEVKAWKNITAGNNDLNTIPNAGVVSPVTRKSTSEAGSEVAKTSTENADMTREASGKGGANNTVVSNNVSSNNTTKIVPMKANPRPEYTGSSLDRYTNRITVY